MAMTELSNSGELSESEAEAWDIQWPGSPGLCDELVRGFIQDTVSLLPMTQMVNLASLLLYHPGRPVNSTGPSTGIAAA